MYDDNEIPASLEQQMEALRRGALDLDAWQLDEQLAIASVRRDVARAHGLMLTAANWDEAARTYADVRLARMQVAREIEDLTGPPSPVVRPLTAGEMDDIRFDDEAPC